MTLEQRLTALAQAIGAKIKSLPLGDAPKSHTQSIGYPAATSGKFTVSDAAVTAASKISLALGVMGDEAEFMTGLIMSAAPTNGSFDVHWSQQAPWAGDLKINYTVG